MLVFFVVLSGVLFVIMHFCVVVAIVRMTFAWAVLVWVFVALRITTMLGFRMAFLAALIFLPIFIMLVLMIVVIAPRHFFLGVG
ncbi:hypothetical protein [Pseudovibrio sp. Alg231-02]|uniref:hypothetical protein n=1 Tax=Pseudovibrio sp. Alg231-02 TaxID=1922223 RepID=UPI0018FF9789|nr:hypothetical protein [Pseudovibrio sp. Alg231-02]